VVLHQALLAIQDNPGIGPIRPEISGDHRVFPAGRHIIIYRVKTDTVWVSRILHGRMDVRRHM
jgi:toxin ParE1/3/4